MLAGRTVLLRDAPTLPHIGWNQVDRRRAHPIVAGIPDGADLYFVHSFVAAPTDPTTIVAETTHGTAFPSVVASANVIGVQFHPERSGADGLRILADFARIASTGEPALGSAPPVTPQGRSDAPSPSLVGGDR